MNTIQDIKTANKDLREKHPVIHSTFVGLASVGAAVVILSAQSLVRKIQF
jgi:hypothetical protein